jgi:hypothetical protein
VPTTRRRFLRESGLATLGELGKEYIGWFFGPEVAVQGLYFSLIPELSQPAFE